MVLLISYLAPLSIINYKATRTKGQKPPGSGIFSTKSYPFSIVCAEAFHYRVRDGNGWFHLALITRRLFFNIDDIPPLVKELVRDYLSTSPLLIF